MIEKSYRMMVMLGTNSITLVTLQRGVERFRPDDIVESTIPIACKDQRGCARMAKDLDALVDAFGVPRGTYAARLRLATHSHSIVAGGLLEMS
jgi:hypothetical protein